MKFFSVLALAAAASAAVTPNAETDANMGVNEQAQAAPQAQVAGAQPNHWFPPPPPPPPQWCQPGTYSCTPDNRGWRVCGVNHQWTYAGSCGWNQHCYMNWQNRSPYCARNW